MSLIDDYSQARRDELAARIRRVLTLRAMIASGLTQREIAEQLGITQPAVSQQLHATSPVHAAIKDLGAIQEVFETVLAKSVDVVSYGGLKPLIDDDIRRDMVRL